MPSLKPIAPTDQTPGQTGIDKPPVQERPAGVYIVACFLGSVLISLAGVFGALLLAYGAGVLVSKGKTPHAFVAAGVGCIPCFFMSVSTGASVLVLGMLTVFFTASISRKFTQGFWITAALIITAAIFVLDTATAFMAGTTVAAQVNSSVQQSMSDLTAAGSIPAESLNVVEDAVSTVVLLWPSMYFIQGAIYMGSITVGALLAFTRHMQSFKVKRFAELDITIHAIWPFVAGLVCFALSYANTPYATYLKVIGLNVLLCMALIYSIQGLALIEYWMERSNMHPAVRVLLYILALQFELMFMFLTIIGLLDFWINFRKLPRDAQDADGTIGGGDAAQ